MKFGWLLAVAVCCMRGEVAVAQIALSQSEAASAAAEAWQEQAQLLSPQLQQELSNEAIEADGKKMKFVVRQFGELPKSGAALYISMHGGGGAPARVNDQQWQNQIRLYEPEEGFYVAPRAPTDSWNLWHESHIDSLFDRMIQAFVICKGVDPNRIYLMGYSAGGDGVYQLAPRMSDRWAACGMMAGHPNETKAEGLRNVPFALFMGGKDAAYDRNKIAARWEAQLKELAAADPDGYRHWVKIYPEFSHWMNREDREALPWMAQQIRIPWPSRVVWVQDDVFHDRLYWLGVPERVPAQTTIVGDIKDQRINIETSVSVVELYLNDKLIDLDHPVQVVVNGSKVFDAIVPRSMDAIQKSLATRLDRDQIATAYLKIDTPVKN